MTDLEITALCAEAMGINYHGQNQAWKNSEFDGMLVTYEYDPLHHDAQAMALVRRFKLFVEPPVRGISYGWECFPQGDTEPRGTGELNRAICECVAKMQKAKR